MLLRLALVLGLASCGGGSGAPDDAGELDALIDAPQEDVPNDDVGIDAPLDAGTDAPLDAFEPLGPPYPIVLSHGFFGFETLAVGEWDITQYYFGVPEHLESELGETLVFTPEVDPFNDSVTRGAQLRAAIEAILAETGHAKVNLIAHSQGGLDSRYVASVAPELVASVTTIATPHEGTPLLEVVVAATDNPFLRGPVNELLRLVGGVLWDEVDEGSDLFAALEQLSAEGTAAFNEAYPDSEEVAYFSIAGRSGLVLARELCTPDREVSWIAQWDDERDPVDPLLAVSESLFDGTFGSPEPNDGLVRVSSSRHGTFLGCIPADHLDEVGQLFGDRPGTFNAFDHEVLYAELVSFLRGEGY